MTMELQLPENWEWAAIDDVAESIRYGFTKKSTSERIGPRYLRITDIQNGSVNWDRVPYCEIDKDDEAKYRLRPGDILFARSGATAGKTFLVKECPRAVFASYLIRVRTFPQVVPEYLYAILNSTFYWDQLTKRGNAQPNANARVLGRIRFPLAPYAEQMRIVSRLATAFSQVVVIRKSLQVASDKVALAEKAILLRALSGELVAHDSNDEPARTLLERIRAERTTMNKKGKSQTVLEMARPARITPKA